MFAIYIRDIKGDYIDRVSGWFKDVRIHTGKKYLNIHNKLQRIEPVIANAKDKRKVWKTETAAVKYAKALASKFEITYVDKFYSSREYPNTVIMKYEIRVFDLDTNNNIYTIDSYKYHR